MTVQHPRSDASIRDALHSADRIVIGLDFDGTLVPIVSNPDDAYLDDAGRRVLRSLVRLPGVEVAVVSGRALDDVRDRVAVEDVALAGNHGLEIEAGARTWVHPDVARIQSQLERVANALERTLGSIPGAFVETKGATASVHYRRVPPDRRDAVAEHVLRTVEGARELTIEPGKAVYEVRPDIGWDKGDAVARLANPVSSETLVMYVGDDRTDADAFERLDSLPCRHVTIRVGPDAAGTTHQLVTPAGVLRWLQWVACTHRSAVNAGLPE